MQFLLFAFLGHEACGGIDDLRSVHATLEDALAQPIPSGRYAQIVDMTGEVPMVVATENYETVNGEVTVSWKVLEAPRFPIYIDPVAPMPS